MSPGTRIRFTKDIIEHATGDHPTFLLARDGTGGEVVRHDPSVKDWPYLVKWDEWEAPFWAGTDDFEAAKDAP